jgi:hypothetical protein
MAMNKKVSTTLDPAAMASLKAIMQRNGWTKSQVIRKAIWAVAESRGLVRRSTKASKS